VECGKLGEGSMGWRAMLGTDVDDEDASARTYVSCPDCADRGFRPASTGTRADDAYWSGMRSCTVTSNLLRTTG
jgi:hypothetical protein